MKVIAQSAVNNTVKRNEDILVSETIYVDRNFEAKGSISADVYTLEIEDAYYELLASNDNGTSDGINHLTFAPGTKAFIDGKKAFRRMDNEQNGKKIRYLMDQCINGVIQAESYIYAERGFKDREEYNLYWDELEKNGCRMYLYPAPQDKRWMDYIPQGKRIKTLFNRQKMFNIIERSGILECNGVFIDSYHELNIIICCESETGIIISCEIEYSRAPGVACFTNKKHGNTLEGKSIYTITKKEILNSLGRSEGCYHLVEITADICRIAAEAINE